MRIAVVVSCLLVAGCGKPAAPATGTLRIVSASPAVTEIIFALGAGEHLVGVTKYCDYPEAAKAVPKIGEFLPATISLETVVAMKPDIAFTDSGVQAPLAQSLTKLGLNAVEIRIDSLDALKIEIDRIATAIGKSPTALLDSFRDRERAVAIWVGGKPRPTVFISLGGPTLVTVGPNTLIHEMVTLAGGQNVFADAKQAFATVSNEELLTRDPDVIVVPRSKDVDVQRKELLAKPGWANLKAVRTNRLYFANEDTLSRAGPRYVDALDELADCFHPKVP